MSSASAAAAAGAHDRAKLAFSELFFQQLAQCSALIKIVDPSADSDFAQAGDQHHMPARQGEDRRQGRALAAHGVAQDLHQDLLAGAQ